MSDELQQASDEGDVEAVRAALDAGADPNYRGEHGWTPLLEAAYGGTEAHLTIARLLLDRGADIEAQPALHGAASHGHLAMMDLLIERGASLVRLSTETHQPPLHWACGQLQTDAARKLLDAGAPVDARDGDGWTALMVAAHWDPRGLATLKVVLEAGADPNAQSKDGWTALLLATAPEMIAPLLAAGADPNLAHSVFGMTPLMALQMWDHVRLDEATRLLLDAGADPTPVLAKVVVKGKPHKPCTVLAANLASEWRKKVRTRVGKTALEMARAKAVKDLLR